MKLRHRVNLYTAAMFIVLLIIINVSIYSVFRSTMLNSELERTAGEALHAIDGLNKAEGNLSLELVLRSYVPVNGMLQIVKADGNPGAAAADPNLLSLHHLPVDFYQKEVREIREHNGTPYAFVSIPIILNNGGMADLQATGNLAQTAEMLRSLRLVLILVTVLATIPVLLSSALLSNFIIRPIASMINTMKEIRESGQFKRIPLPKKSKDELYQMAETFNKMMHLLEVNYEKQGQFISNASHELKTPLTVIESYASLLKRRGRQQPELFDEAVEAIHSEAIRMRDLTQQLLQLAKHEDQWQVTMENVNLASITEALVSSFQKAYNRSIELNIQDRPVVRTDQQMFRQLFYILMDNARKYSEDVITVNIKTFSDGAVIEIADRGIGIPADDLEKIFDRFYRVDKARTRKKTGGFGLGLSLAKEIGEAMDADIQIESVESEGTTARIIFPGTTSY
ncbi:histidine kinase [Mesobacillus campisalis]|uniref:histidine kinase n=1 Tax=Mesobacillus campisalis TaxID=1408103 RepID=A0A0M2T3L2_9BACI|nr:HAMP domain-containing sensor histidine kinase [Mesobacillus campisalis]KKK39390.1 histidine kinase [Mesobacillus campisalis]